MAAHELYAVWEDTTSYSVRKWTWRAQLFNFIGQFETKEKAESFVAAIKDYRKKNGLK